MFALTIYIQSVSLFVHLNTIITFYPFYNLALFVPFMVVTNLHYFNYSVQKSSVDRIVSRAGAVSGLFISVSGTPI